MIGYVTLGANDFDKAADFYDALLAELGAVRVLENDRLIVWGTGPASPALAVIRPFDGKAATAGNGVMVALAVKDPETVQKLHRKALALGGCDEGAPGPRGQSTLQGFYAGYFRDLDGNKLNAFCIMRG